MKFETFKDGTHEQGKRVDHHDGVAGTTISDGSRVMARAATLKFETYSAEWQHLVQETMRIQNQLTALKKHPNAGEAKRQRAALTADITAIQLRQAEIRPLVKTEKRRLAIEQFDEVKALGDHPGFEIILKEIRELKQLFLAIASGK